MLRFTINFKGVELDVEGFYTEAEELSDTYQGAPQTFEAHFVYAGGVDIINLICDVEDVEKAVLEQHY